MRDGCERKLKTALATLALLMTIALGCGDGLFIISVNFGTISSDPFCDRGTGRFDLLTQGGLVLLVVISSDTVIVNANGGPGRCTDLTTGAQVQVRGSQQGTQIAAQSVTLV